MIKTKDDEIKEKCSVEALLYLKLIKRITIFLNIVAVIAFAALVPTYLQGDEMDTDMGKTTIGNIAGDTDLGIVTIGLVILFSLMAYYMVYSYI